MICPKCGIKRVFDFAICPSCGHNMIETSPKADESSPSISVNTTTAIASQPSSSATTESIQALKFFAWLDLVAGIVGSIFIWVNYSKTTVPGYYSVSEINPVGIGLGIAALVQGIFCCVLFLVIAQMAENIIVIKTNSFHKSAAA
jgi:hypothetical protein